MRTSVTQEALPPPTPPPFRKTSITISFDTQEEIDELYTVLGGYSFALVEAAGLKSGVTDHMERELRPYRTGGERSTSFRTRDTWRRIKDGLNAGCLAGV